MDKWEVYPIKVLSIALLIMVTLLIVSSFNYGGTVAGPQRPLPLVVGSLDSMNLSRKRSLQFSTSTTYLPCGRPLRYIALSLTNGLGLSSRSRWKGGRTDTRMGWVGCPWPIGLGPIWPGSVAPSSMLMLSSSSTEYPLIMSFWCHHPRDQDRRPSRMNSDLYVLVLEDDPS
jgi:hypothetical protein